ncbi:signal recognition particle-docking protein FtsY [[Mycoplasma] testudinis]|uniref:signal recognition particle-docking protein FtsY n=1 Tax=[Mycoplasma] testudinis TaxID=33924 RepID=UPI00047F129D|nr:signal recognition particle-docking protein FtsY [[Mycoplasma] testudinis]
MGFFSNLFGKLKKKKDLIDQIHEKTEANRVFVQDQKKYDAGLRLSANNFSNALNNLSKQYVQLDETFFENLFELLVSLDIGYASCEKILEAIKDEVRYQNVNDPKLLKEIIVDKLFVYYIQDTEFDTSLNYVDGRTNVFLMIGVNGVGKTTSIAKIANRFKKLNKKILFVAGDTFRAGAVEQLKIWAERTGCDIVTATNDKQDAPAVIYQGVKKGVEEKYDLVICDTSGRLQNKINLMNELKKIRDVIAKFVVDAPHETLLVLDATTGQSGLNQAKAFNELTKVSGIILTKTDSSSKGGIILGIKDSFKIPVKLIGLGEQLDDLADFDLEKYILGMTAGLGLDESVHAE